MRGNRHGDALVRPGLGLGLGDITAGGVGPPHSRNGRPGYGGLLQHENRGGWHVLGHAGRVAGEIVADYSLVHQYRTQAGVRPMLVNVYSIHYMSN